MVLNPKGAAVSKPKKPAVAKSKKPATKKSAVAPGERFGALQDKNTELEKQVILIQAELAKEKALREAAEKSATTKKAGPHRSVNIPKPKGSAGNGFKLITEMKLVGDNELYKMILREVPMLGIQAGLDYREDFKNQPAAKLGLVYKLVREQIPYLDEFENDWATAEIIKQYLYNKRKNSVSKGYIPPCAERLQAAKTAGKVANIHSRGKGKAVANKENTVVPRGARAEDVDEQMDEEGEQEDDGEGGSGEDEENGEQEDTEVEA
ncbi:hypothetical protein B0H21DRAFT_711943 [Amylocystis lapponica]|nr:hypothetical protein B0H21DRAFT_711943 [Amylocystis lapponica]